MFTWLKDLLQPIRSDDPQFGTMRFLRQTSTWESATRLSPPEDPIEVFVIAPRSGPTDRQREIFSEFVKQYSQVLEQARPAIAEVIQSSQLTKFVFRLAAVTLAADSDPEYDIELTFGDPAGPPQLDVRFVGWQIREILGPL